MIKKYKVHEVAKDFDIPSKFIIEKVSQYFESEKKSQTALEEKELDFFGRLLSLKYGGFGEEKEFADREPKIVSTPVCKSAKRHIEQLRKCYWLNKTRNEELKRIISSKGFRTEQDWFNFMVDEEIEKAKEILLEADRKER